MQTKSINILVVEDDDIDAEGLERALKSAKLLNPLYRARDGIEALEMLRGTGGAERVEPPLVVLLDLNMPRMDGIEFLHALRGERLWRGRSGASPEGY